MARRPPPLKQATTVYTIKNLNPLHAWTLETADSALQNTSEAIGFEENKLVTTSIK